MTPKELHAWLLWSGLNHEAFARWIGVTPGAVAHWLNGRREIPLTTVRILQFFASYPQLMTEFK